jgi:hypothetical protein
MSCLHKFLCNLGFLNFSLEKGNSKRNKSLLKVTVGFSFGFSLSGADCSSWYDSPGKEFMATLLSAAL